MHPTESLDQVLNKLTIRIQWLEKEKTKIRLFNRYTFENNNNDLNLHFN